MDRRVRYQPRPAYRPRYQTPVRRQVWQPPKLSTWQWRLLLALMVLGLAAAGLEHYFAITTITVEPAVLQSDVSTKLRGLMSHHLGQGNLLTLSSATLTQELLQADPGLSQVTITRNWPHGLTVSVAEKVATIGWESAGQTYILDSGGHIIGQAATSSHLLVVQDDSNLPVTTGAQVATAGFVTFCQQLGAQIPNTGLSLTKLEVHDTTYDLYATTNKGYQIIFDTQRPVGEEIADLQVTLKTLATQHKTPASYIDLRVAGRAYYK